MTPREDTHRVPQAQAATPPTTPRDTTAAVTLALVVVTLAMAIARVVLAS